MRGCDKVLQREGKEKHELPGVPPGARHAVLERVVEGERESQGRLARRSNLGVGVSRQSHDMDV